MMHESTTVKSFEENCLKPLNREMMIENDEREYKYLCIKEMDTSKEMDKEKFAAEQKRILKLLLKSKLKARNMMLAINMWAV